MLKIICILFVIHFTATNESKEYIDPVIDLLLNGDNTEANSSEVIEDDSQVLIAGVWKCGNCTDIDDSKLVYSEDNYVNAGEDDDADIQVELMLQGMRCVTVSADKPGVVKRISGACDDVAVTLHMAPARHFIIQVYA